MARGSFASGALAELTVEELGRMLELDETLFVEHKSNLRPDGAYNLMKAVASFANTVGGWVLIGVHKGRPVAEPGSWASADGPALVDQVRDRLRMEIDPLPAFEARVLQRADGPVGVVRVYESSDTPHVAISTGSVFVREVAGTGDVSEPKRPGAGLRGERAYRAAQIRSRAQLVELTERGRRAGERVMSLVDPLRPLPLANGALGLEFERVAENRIQPKPSSRGAIIVRLVPYTLPPRFQGWTTTSDASAAVLSAAEDLADRHGMANDWVTPHPSGASVEVGLPSGRRHCVASGGGLDALARIVLDSAGVAGAALWLDPPDDPGRRSHLTFGQIAEQLVEPVLQAAAAVLAAGEIIGRAWCQVDLIGLDRALLMERQGKAAGLWVPSGGDLPLPSEPDELTAAARRAVYAYARSAELPAWDPPVGNNT